jgi:hypothetical protein
LLSKIEGGGSYFELDGFYMNLHNRDKRAKIAEIVAIACDSSSFCAQEHFHIFMRKLLKKGFPIQIQRTLVRSIFIAYTEQKLVFITAEESAQLIDLFKDCYPHSNLTNYLLFV